MVMCTVPSSDRRRRFLQYNFMDPGWGGGQNFLQWGARSPCPLPPAGAVWVSGSDPQNCRITLREDKNVQISGSGMPAVARIACLNALSLTNY